jgi:hypothetical protein
MAQLPAMMIIGGCFGFGIGVFGAMALYLLGVRI